MKRIKLEGKQIGALVAVMLGLVILFLPAQDSAKYRFDPGEIAGSIGEKQDHVDPVTLSEWIIEGRRDYRLVDIRRPEEFEAGNIKGAENIPLERLLQKSTLEEFTGDRLVVIYSNGSTHAGQAWLVMKAAGLDAYMLEGGFNYWNRVIMNPEVPTGDEISDDEILRYKTRAAVKNYFGGDDAAVSDELALKNNPPKKIIPKPKTKKNKLKGC